MGFSGSELPLLGKTGAFALRDSGHGAETHPAASGSGGAAPARVRINLRAGLTLVQDLSSALFCRRGCGRRRSQRSRNPPPSSPRSRLPVPRAGPSLRGCPGYPHSRPGSPFQASPSRPARLRKVWPPEPGKEVTARPRCSRGTPAPHLNDRLQRGSVHDGGADEGVGILVLAVDLPHGKDHGDGEEKGGDPDAADELLGAATGHDALGFERVADGHVALHAEAGDVERRGVGAGVPEEVVALADGPPKSPGVMDPDEVVELDGHAEEEDEEVGEGEAGQVVVHGALQVLQRLLAHQRVRRDRVTHRAHQEKSQVDDGHHHFGVDVGVNVQVLLVGHFGEQVGAVGGIGVADGVQVEGAAGHGRRSRGVQVHPGAGPVPAGLQHRTLPGAALRRAAARGVETWLVLMRRGGGACGPGLPRVCVCETHTPHHHHQPPPLPRLEPALDVSSSGSILPAAPGSQMRPGSAGTSLHTSTHKHSPCHP